MTPPRAGAIVVAAGSGTRMGRPKQFLPLCGRPVMEWSLSVFERMPEIAELVLVLSPQDAREHGPRLAQGKVKVVEGGATRLGSVRNGLARMSRDVEVVAVHDGARPLLTPELARKVLEDARAHGAAVAAVPVKDTLKEVRPGELWVERTPERAAFWQAQTPQAYRRGLLQGALERFAGQEDASDESQLVERAGARVRVVPSSYENIKITTPEDLVLAAALLGARQAAGVRLARAGFGYDIHRLVEGRELWLAGIKLPSDKGLLGHSDADAVLHAAADAVLGALGEGEIGVMFPPEDERHRGIASSAIVARVLEVLERRQGEILNLDVTVVAERPKLKAHYPAMAESLARVFRLPRGRVNVKAKSHEGLGELGRGEAIACYAVASVAVAG